MSDRLWRQPGMTHLDIQGGGEGRKKEILFGVALGGVVIVAVAVILFYLFHKPAEVHHMMMHMICTNPECNHEFDMNSKDLPWDRLAANPTERERADCPKCGGQLTCVEATHCPACGKYFAPPQDSGPTMCPFCHIDIGKYVREHR